MESQKNILILDGDLDTQEVLAKLQEEYSNIAYISLKPTEEIMKSYKHTFPDLIFVSTDHIAHPDFDLMEIFNLMTHSNIPVIYLSSNPLEETEKELYQSFYLAKPLELSAVRDTIKTILNL